MIRERVKLNRMTGYLTEHCNEKLTLSAMAEACQVSTGAFFFIFSGDYRTFIWQTTVPFPIIRGRTAHLFSESLWIIACSCKTIFHCNSGKPPFIKIIQRSKSFSEGYCDHDPSDSIVQFDPSGIIIAGGVVGLLIGLSIVPRYAGITHTGKHILLYEDITLLGIVCGNLFFLYGWHIPGGTFTLLLYGLFSGIFLGGWITTQRIPLVSLILLEKMGKTSAISASAMIHPPRKKPEKSP